MKKLKKIIRRDYRDFKSLIRQNGLVYGIVWKAGDLKNYVKGLLR